MPSKERLLNREQMRDVLRGATFFGCGGGGSYANALALVSNLSSVCLKQPERDETYVVHFGIGALGSSVEKTDTLTHLRYFESVYKKKVDGIVGGELGPLVLALNLVFCAETKLPLIDCDAGGGRAVPNCRADIFTPLNLPRLPLVVAAGQKFWVVNDCLEENIDAVLDSIYASEKKGIMILGYGMNGELAKKFPKNTILRCEQVGKDAREERKIREFVPHGCFIVEKILSEEGRFSKVIIRGEGFEIIAVNEIVVASKNGEVIAAMPNLIVLFSPEHKRCLLMNEIKIGQEVWVLSRAAESPMNEKAFSEQYLSPSVFLGSNWNSKLKSSIIVELTFAKLRVGRTRERPLGNL